MTDQELIEGIRKGERTAIKQLVSGYQKKVIKTAYYFLGNLEEAEDLSQEVFIEILNSMRMFNKTSSLSTWVYRITVNKSLNQIKKIRRKGIFIRLESLFHPIHPSKDFSIGEPSTTNTTMEENEKRKIIHRALNSLPENQQIAFVLHKYDDRSYREISEIMNLSLSSVESLIHRAKLNLQKRLVSDFSEYTKS